MSEDKRYNGWTNRETWLVALWVDNEEGLYHERRELVRNTLRPHDPAGKDEAVAEVSAAVKDWITEMLPEGCKSGGLWSDLMGTALAKVDWTEIAEHWIDEEWEL